MFDHVISLNRCLIMWSIHEMFESMCGQRHELHVINGDSKFKVHVLKNYYVSDVLCIKILLTSLLKASLWLHITVSLAYPFCNLNHWWHFIAFLCLVLIFWEWKLKNKQLIDPRLDSPVLTVYIQWSGMCFQLIISKRYTSWSISLSHYYGTLVGI
jgi:hypothetical protein